MQVFSALQNLHTALVHGDVNAGNIVWDPSGHFFQFVDLEFSTWTTAASAPALPHVPLSPPAASAATPTEFQSTPNGRRSRGHSTVSNHSTSHSTSQVFASPAASSKKSWRSPGSHRGSPSPHPSPGLSSRGGEGPAVELGRVGAAARTPQAAGPSARSGSADLARIVSPGLVSWPLMATAHGSTAAGRLAPHGTLELASFNQLKGCVPTACGSISARRAAKCFREATTLLCSFLPGILLRAECSAPAWHRVARGMLVTAFHGHTDPYPCFLAT